MGVAVSLIDPTLLLTKFKYSNVLFILVFISMFVTNVNNYFCDCTLKELCKVSTKERVLKPALEEGYKELINVDGIKISDLRLGTRNEYVYSNFIEDIELINQRTDKVVSLSDNLLNPQILVNEVLYLEFSVEGAGIVCLPRFYYSDYVLKDQEGNKYELYNDQGLLNAKVKANKTSILEHKENIIPTLAKVARIVGILVLIFLVIKLYKKPRKSTNQIKSQ